MNTYNFKIENYTYDYPSQAAGTFKDLRNGILCTNPSLNLECYLNYIQLLDGLKDLWKNNGYLHMGMMPVVMGPSFMHNRLVQLISARLNELGITYYSMPPVSLLYDICRMDEQDIWMFREDAAKFVGKSNVTAIEFLRRCLT